MIVTIILIWRAIRWWPFWSGASYGRDLTVLSFGCFELRFCISKVSCMGQIQFKFLYLKVSLGCFGKQLTSDVLVSFYLVMFWVIAEL
jgi:hypothetical protein